jgi:hypothetical protein
VTRRAALLVRLTLPLAAALACAGATPAGSSGSESVQAQVGQPFTLAPGESASLDSGKLTVKFVAVSEDSRCPKNEQCVWAGNARVELEVRAGGAEARRISLQTNRGAPEAEVDAYSLLLEDIAPLPISGRPIAAADYRVTLRVSRGSATGRGRDEPVR